MNTHRKRLIDCGLYTPFSNEETARRNDILVRMASGEKIDSFIRPNMCVFRSDGPYTHILLNGNHSCRDAELIAELLTYWEASRLCDFLNLHDTELPITHPKSLYRQSLYKLCSKEDWDIWDAQKVQMSIFDEMRGNV